MKKFFVATVIALALYGCGDDKQELPVIGGDVSGSPAFRLPGSVFRLDFRTNDNAATKREWFFQRTTWKPRGWSIWVASNVYSDARAPKGDLAFLNKGFTRAATAAQRAKEQTQFLAQISKFVRDNKVPLEINYLGYDSLPDSLINRDDNSNGNWLSFNNEPCEKAFRLCIDNYMVSPAARYSGTDRLSYKDWIAPFLPQGNSDHATIQKYVIDHMGGSTDEASPFYDYWPTMVFLVNGDGKVVRAWLPQKNDTATARQVEAAIVTDMGGPYKDLEIADNRHSAGLPSAGYYGKYYIETGVDRVLETFKLIVDKK
ncbi:hypothetical protein [Pseudomonas sp. NPDC089569]|uniref:hypothetical protein n=1 Tax=Pseudomonas sp. NPDC089569 TaxID=3390722 RepID=UPI003D052CE1